MPHAALTMKLAEKEAPVGYVSRVTDSREGGFPSECILGTHSRAAPKVGEENLGACKKHCQNSKSKPYS